jgi:hypothetical protein
VSESSQSMMDSVESVVSESVRNAAACDVAIFNLGSRDVPGTR